MSTTFDPKNKIIQLCMQGMAMEDSNNLEEARELFLKGWNEAENDFERFIAAYYVARREKDASNQLKWLETSLKYALDINDENVKSAFPSLYTRIAKCYEELGNP